MGGDLRRAPVHDLAIHYPSHATHRSGYRRVQALRAGSGGSYQGRDRPGRRYLILWPCWSWAGERELWAGKYKTTGHGSLIVTTLTGRVTFVSEPVPGNQHDMAKLAGSECETILKLAASTIGDKGFIGTDYIITPVRKPKGRDLHKSEHDYNSQISSLRAPVERAVASLKTWRILFTDYRRPLKTFLSSFRAAVGLYFFKEGFA